jgi:hypothetical protein
MPWLIQSAGVLNTSWRFMLLNDFMSARKSQELPPVVVPLAVRGFHRILALSCSLNSTGVRSATICFSRRFSSSNCLSRLTYNLLLRVPSSRASFSSAVLCHTLIRNGTIFGGAGPMGRQDLVVPDSLSWVLPILLDKLHLPDRARFRTKRHSI